MFVIKMCSYSGDGIEMFSLRMFFLTRMSMNVHELFTNFLKKIDMNFSNTNLNEFSRIFFGRE